ncbi:MAG: cysteine desulfurase [Gemmatales bacterium]|nr:cysteine desulfurase [Gemmatales bacterium]MDW8388391.1 cysteine desulfurase family protein [Gemmatales bacterium]
MTTIYLDYASTTPLLPEVAEAMRPFWAENFGNPASAHQFGRKARRAVEDARELIAQLLGAYPDEVIFTSGATEANNWAIQGLVPHSAGVLIVSPLEHPSVAEPVQYLTRRGHRLHQLRATREGFIDLADPFLDSLLKADLATVMLVNNETGVVQPVRELVRRLEGRVRFFHGDAVQAVGKMPVHFHDLGVTTLSLSAHKFHGPRGIGALLVRRGTPLQPLFLGGHQQMGKRPGTEPVPLIVGMAKALELAEKQRESRWAHVLDLRTLFLKHLEKQAGPIHVNGCLENSIPYLVNVSFPGCAGDLLLARLDLAGVACSTGSACSSGSLLPSPVLRAMNLPDDLLKSAIRFSFSHVTSEPEVVAAAERVAEAVAALRTG